jgi:hypothetical protein
MPASPGCQWHLKPLYDRAVTSDWHRRRVEAAARSLDATASEGTLRRAALAVRAADQAAGDVVPREEFDRLALDYSACNVRALQTEELLDRALEALDRVAAAQVDVPAYLRDLCFATAAEVRAMLDARRDDDDGPDHWGD